MILSELNVCASQLNYASRTSSLKSEFIIELMNSLKADCHWICKAHYTILIYSYQFGICNFDNGPKLYVLSSGSSDNIFFKSLAKSSAVLNVIFTTKVRADMLKMFE